MVVSLSWAQGSPIATTPGQAEKIPYHYLPGSTTGTIDSPEIAQSAETLFPTADGVSKKLRRFDFTSVQFADVAFPKVNGVDGLTIAPSALNPSAFLSWHTAHQLRYIAEKGTGTPKSIELTDPTNSANKLHAIASADGKKVIVLEQLGKADIAKMSLTDQTNVASLPAFSQSGGLADRLGLIPTAGATVTFKTSTTTNATATADTATSARNAVLAYLDGEINYYTINPFVGTFSTSGAWEVFRDALKNLRSRLENSAVFSLKDIQDQVQKIEARYDRAKAFGEVFPETQLYENFPRQGGGFDDRDSGEWLGVISLDNNATIKNGFEQFMKQERQMLAIDNHRLQVIQSGMLKDKKLDVPNLVFLLQLDYNLYTEAKVIADTEEISQQNALLQTYGRMQQQVNQVSKAFGTDQNQTLTLTGHDGNNQEVRSLSTEQQKLFSMFEDLRYNTQKHPIETLRGISRPYAEIFSNGFMSDGNYNKMAELRKTQWEPFGTQLSDTVTLINQENQIKMNDINSQNKQKDRHFDLANSALSKMFDTIQNIARAVGN